MVHSNPSRDLCGDAPPWFPLAEGPPERPSSLAIAPPRDSIPRFVQTPRGGGACFGMPRGVAFHILPICLSFLFDSQASRGCKRLSQVTNGGASMSARWKVGRRGEFGLHTRRCIRQIFGEEGPAGSPRPCTVLRRPSGCASNMICDVTMRARSRFSFRIFFRTGFFFQLSGLKKLYQHPASYFLFPDHHFLSAHILVTENPFPNTFRSKTEDVV